MEWLKKMYSPLSKWRLEVSRLPCFTKMRRSSISWCVIKEEFRCNEDEIGKILVPAMDGTMVPIKELSEIKTITGPYLSSVIIMPVSVP